jgi:hypothetical protein
MERRRPEKRVPPRRVQGGVVEPLLVRGHRRRDNQPTSETCQK